MPAPSSPSRLYVIGNGFDLHHGLRTGFGDFRYHLSEEIGGECEETVEEFLCELEGDWSNLESALAHLDSERLREYASQFLVGYGADDWTDAYHHDYQFEMEQKLDVITRDLVRDLGTWISQVPIPNPDVTPRLLDLDESGTFLTFNYTATLQRLYEVDRSRVLHVHGSCAPGGSPILLGHGWTPSPTPRPSREEIEEMDPRVSEGEQLIERYFQQTMKPTSRLIEQNAAFFESLAGVDEVIILGHSLSPVDLPYFEAIVGATTSPAWYVSYYAGWEKAHHEGALRSIGVPAEHTHLRTMGSFERRVYRGSVVEGDLASLKEG